MALELIEDVGRQGLACRADSYSAAMAVCGKAHETAHVLELLAKVPRRTPRKRRGVNRGGSLHVSFVFHHALLLSWLAKGSRSM